MLVFLLSGVYRGRGGTYGDVDFACSRAGLDGGPEGAVDLRSEGVAERQSLAVRAIGDLVRGDAAGHFRNEKVVCRLNAVLLRPENAVTGAGALLRRHILDRRQPTVVDAEDADEVGAEIGHHHELGGRVHDGLVWEGRGLAYRVDGSVGERECGRLLNHAAGTGAVGVDAVSAAARTR